MFPNRCLGFPGVSDDKESASSAGDPGSIPGSRRSPEKGMAPRSSILAWRILWTGATILGVAKSQT